MIRHRPAGLGHPYGLEPDQRVPPDPVENQPIELRATTPLSVGGLEAEIEIGGRRERRVATTIGPDASAMDAGEGHLASAAARTTGKGRRAWSVCLPPLAAGTRVRYAFLGEGGWRTRWFAFTVAGWRPDGGRLVVERQGSDPAGQGAVGPRRSHGAPEPASAAETRLVVGSVAWLQDGTRTLRVRFALRLEPGAHVVGFGERFDVLDQRGRRLDATVFEQYKGQGNRTYLPMPFAMVLPVGAEPADGEPASSGVPASGASASRASASGPSAWGFHVRTTARTWYDVGASDPGLLWVEAALDPNRADPTLVVALYAGTPRDIVAAFLAETGRPALPPAWIFRPWMSGNEWNSQARVRAEVERSLAEGIPVGVVVVEAWSDETTFVAFRDARYDVHPDGSPHRLADFTLPANGAWPDPRGLVEWLHARDVRLILWQVPLLRTRPAPSGQARADRDTMVARGYGVRDGRGRPYRNRGWWFPGALLPDWTNPDAKEWWLAKRRYLVEEVGIDGFKTDGGEHAWGDELRYTDGTRGVETNNRYPVLYAGAYHDLMRSCGRPPVTFSRAGFTGAGAAPAHWAGDEDSTWAAFRASVTAGLTAGASGVLFWGWDLGGFSGEIPSAELYLRSAAMACFCPIMQYHSEFHGHRRPSRDRTPWNIAERTGDPRVLPVYRRFARARELLVPYLVEQARRAVERRLPLMRALFLDWPADPETWGHPFEYMLGDDLLVAPVVEPGATTWEVYLPAGEWIDVWTGERVTTDDAGQHGPGDGAVGGRAGGRSGGGRAGGRVVTRAVPLDVIPVYRRADATGLSDLSGLR